MEKLIAILVGGGVVIAGILALSFLMSFPLFLAWDYVMPTAFKLPALTWTQAWALSFVSSALIKSGGVKS